MTELLDGIQLGELRGRRQKAMSAVAVRPLQEADIAVLAQGERRATPPTSVKRLRDRHHIIARLVVAGKSNPEISLITGMDPTRISVLRGDPAFKELVADYKKIEDGVQAEVHNRLVQLNLTVVEEIQDRIENSEEPVPLSTLLEVGKFTADRIGHGPITKQMNTNVNVDLSGRLAAARKRVASLPPPDKVTDAEFVEVRTGTDD